VNATPPHPSLSPAELERLLVQVEPAAVLVPPRILRRVIKKASGLGGLGLQVPHRKSYVIGREALLAIADRHELGLPADRLLPETLLLFPQPDPHKLRHTPPAESLRYFWRLLFHARVHQALDQRRRAGHLDDEAIRRRVGQFGPAVFEEIEAVLRQERFLLPPGDARAVYEEFASLYLELRSFAPHLVPRYFPTLLATEAVDRVLAEDVPAGELFAQTRLPGAADPAEPDDLQDEQSRSFRWNSARAERAAARGNTARAAIFRQRAVHSATGLRRAQAEADALKDIDRLAGRLQQALRLDDVDAELWRQSLPALLEPASQGPWPVEARLLYDLQKVCINEEKEVYAVDLVEWIVSWGKQPIKRKLPNQRVVLSVRYLRRALHRLTSARLPDLPRQQLATLLTKAIAQAEKDLRDQLRPRIAGVLDEVGLKPATVAERLSRDKLIEELLDRAVEHGYLNMGDLRDAIARNRVKLADLSHPGEFFRGDPLIKANRGLALALDGVYHRGEVYLRWLQRFSSLAFGTRVGRFLTLYLLLPFGGAYLILEGLQHVLVDPLYWLFGPPHVRVPAGLKGVTGLIIGAAGEVGLHRHRLHLLHSWSLLLLGFFLLGVVYWPPFRRAVGRGLGLVGRALHALFIGLPAALLNTPLMRRLLQSRLYFVLSEFVGKPLLWTLPAVLALYLAGLDPGLVALTGVLLFLAVSLLLHSRWGLGLEEVLTDGVVRSWHLLSTNLLPGLFHLIIEVFRRLVESVEKLLYTVDEWLRFRRGEGRLALAVKAVLGLVWFVITYVVRFCVNLLIEPQINPIKHFPVVTVSHKLVITLGVPPLAHLLEAAFGMNTAEAFTTATAIGFCIPGIFGFLAWELKENWRLYRANLPPDLQPMIVGHHGETVARLMRPGFHSGTLPRLFARLRRNLRRCEGQSARKQKEALHQVQEGMEAFTRRTLLATLAASRDWGPALPVDLELIRLATRRIRIELVCPVLAGQAGLSAPPERLQLDFEEQAGQLVAGVSQAGWVHALHREQRRVLLDALAGFYKLAGVERLQEEPRDAPTRFGTRVITWAEWVETWERDRHGKGHEHPLLSGVVLLPAHPCESRRSGGGAIVCPAPGPPQLEH
jgi:hypothetical protein